jgi:hypothetical protein
VLSVPTTSTRPSARTTAWVLARARASVPVGTQQSSRARGTDRRRGRGGRAAGRGRRRRHGRATPRDGDGHHQGGEHPPGTGAPHRGLLARGRGRRRSRAANADETRRRVETFRPLSLREDDPELHAAVVLDGDQAGDAGGLDPVVGEEDRKRAGDNDASVSLQACLAAISTSFVTPWSAASQEVTATSPLPKSAGATARSAERGRREGLDRTPRPRAGCAAALVALRTVMSTSFMPAAA